MANADNFTCRDYVPLIMPPQSTEGSGTTAELHDEIIKFCYAYIDNFRCCIDGKKKVAAMNLELEKLREIIRESNAVGGLYNEGMTAVDITVRGIQLPYEYGRYIQEHGIPNDGIYKAELLAKYLQEKADLGIVD